MRHVYRSNAAAGYCTVVATADVDALPGCGQIAVIHNSFVHPLYRKMGYGGEAHAMRLYDIKHEMLFDAAVCTVDMSNTPQIRIMEKFGWNKAAEFTSRKTGHVVGLFVKVL